MATALIPNFRARALPTGLAACLIFALGAPLASAEDLALSAMRAELERSRAGLRMDGYEAPYYIAYQAWETEEHQIGASLGAVFTDESGTRARLDASVRVGDYAMDNSEDGDASYDTLERYQPTAFAPLDRDPRALRHALWLLTDFRYKEALLSYSRVRGQRVFEAEGRADVASFSRETPSRLVEETHALAFDAEGWRERARRLSARFFAHPAIFDSEVQVKARSVIRRMVTTEGTEILTQNDYYSFHAAGVIRADDGMLLDHSVDLYWRRPDGCPPTDELEQAVDRLAADLLALREAPVLDPYTGPAILAPPATGVFFHEAVGHRLEGQRQKGDEEGQTFRGQIGKAVLPTFLTVVDDPTSMDVEHWSLNGGYRFDSEGVPARRTVLVQDGVLKTFLMSRRPIEGFSLSSGHGRAAMGERPVARMGNLFVLVSGGLSEAELKRRLVEEARARGKPFGLLVHGISGGSTNTTAYGYQAFKGTPRMVYQVDAETGEETLVRGVEFVGTPLTSLNRIIAAGNRYEVFNGYCGAESGYVPVATIAPATLFAEIELQRSPRPTEKPQILPAPWRADGGSEGR